MGATFERFVVSVAIGIALAALGVGWHFAVSLNEPHWINRSGALIVSAEALLLFAELSRRARLRNVEVRFGHENPYIAIEALRAERALVVTAAIMIVLGELLHGFGDLLFELVR